MSLYRQLPVETPLEYFFLSMFIPNENLAVTNKILKPESADSFQMPCYYAGVAFYQGSTCWRKGESVPASGIIPSLVSDMASKIV